MAHDGVYSGLSSRASVNEILNQALKARDDVVAAQEAAAVSEENAKTSELQTQADVVTTGANAAATATDRAAVAAALAASNRQFSIYAYSGSVTSGGVVLQITPQYSLEYVAPAVDWLTVVEGTGRLLVNIVNGGVVMSTPITIDVVAGIPNMTIAPHTIFRGDTLRIECTQGTLTNLSMTMRYKSGEV